MNGFLKIGLITKPQGIKGEVKVTPLTDDPARFEFLKEGIIDGEKYKVVNARIGGDSVILSLYGVADRNRAELLRGKFICVDRAHAVELKKDTFFIADVIGCKLKTEDGEKVGEITDVTSAKTDIFTVKTTDGIMRFPFLKDLLISVNVEEKEITVKKKRLEEVCCYED